MKWGKTYAYPLTVQFEDVDCQRVVHHPNYLKYCERARGHALLDEGYSFSSVLENGFGLVISDARLRYLAPLSLEEKATVVSRLFAVSSASFRLRQVIHSGGEELTQKFEQLDVDDWQTLGKTRGRDRGVHFSADIVLVHIELKSAKPRPFHDKLSAMLGLKQITGDFRSSNVKLS